MFTTTAKPIKTATVQTRNCPIVQRYTTNHAKGDGIQQSLVPSHVCHEGIRLHVTGMPPNCTANPPRHSGSAPPPPQQICTAADATSRPNASEDCLQSFFSRANFALKRPLANQSTSTVTSSSDDKEQKASHPQLETGCA